VSTVFRLGLLVGLLGLAAVGPVLAVADHPEHEHPDDVDGNDDLESVERWLGNRMGEMHVDCAEGIGVGSFDACENLDEEYKEMLERYATVENDLQSETETAEQFNETRKQQQEYAALREEFEDTYEDYQTARAAGDDAEARELARELQQLAIRIEALGGDLEVNFVELDDRIAADFTAASRTINESTAETRRIILEVEAESFEATEINATIGNTVSFAEPAPVSGRVTTTNGTGIGGAEVVLTDGAQSFTTTTTANGSYELLYRPTRTRVGTTNLTVQYRPAAADLYLGTETTGRINVRSTDSELRIQTNTYRVAFDRQLVITGSVQAADRPTPAVDITVSAETGQLETTRTESDGSFRAVTRIPVTLETGPQTIEVQASEASRAIEVSRGSIDLTVVETATELNVTGTVTDGTIDVSGQLTADGPADVGRRPISVQIGEETYETRTDPDGSYRISNAVAPESFPVTATATYDEAGTNLDSSRAETTIADDSNDTTTTPTLRSIVSGLLSSLRNSTSFVVGIGVAIVILVMAMIVRRRRRQHAANSTDADPEQPASADSGVEDPTGTTAASVESLLETAREKLQTDPQATVYASYAAVRTLFDTSPEQTHWELYNQQQARGDDRPDEAFYTLTELFERAAFAAEHVDTTQAESALQAAERYLDTTDPGSATD
jgi:plastocyanin/uncharacterized membrane-anchored protein YhcB (DUF1043 family)